MNNKKTIRILRIISLITALFLFIAAFSIPAYSAEGRVSFTGDAEEISESTLYIAGEGRSKAEFMLDEDKGLSLIYTTVFLDVSHMGLNEKITIKDPYKVKAEFYARDFRGDYLDMEIKCHSLTVESGGTKRSLALPHEPAVNEMTDGKIALLNVKDDATYAYAFFTTSKKEKTGFGVMQDLSVAFYYHDTGEPFKGNINYSFTDLDQGDYRELERKYHSDRRGYMEAISLVSGFGKVHVTVPEERWLLKLLPDDSFVPTANDPDNSLYSGFVAESSGEVRFVWTGSECGTSILQLFDDKGGIRITKGSKNKSISEGNENYTLEGAVFDIFKDPGLQEKIISVKTDDGGVAYTNFQLAPGTYHIKESVPPPGFRGTEDVRDVTVESGVMTDVFVDNEPQKAYKEILLKKKDPILEEGPMGDCSLKGSAFLAAMYGNTEGREEGEALCQAVFTTDEEGLLRFEEAYIKEGQWPFRDEKGELIIPLGSLVIKEKEAPLGYSVSEEAVVYVLKEGRELMLVSGQEVKGSVPLFKEGDYIKGGIRIIKADGYLFRGLKEAVFSVINMSANPVSVDGNIYGPGEEVIEIVTNESGTAETGAVLPYGTYSLKEKQAPGGFLKDEDYSCIIKIEENIIYDALPCINYGIPTEQGSFITSYKRSRPEMGAAVSYGDEITYYLDTVNTGAHRSQPYIIRDYIPFGTEFVEGSIEGNGAYVDKESSPTGEAYVEWVSEGLDTREISTVSFKVKVAEAPPVFIENIGYTEEVGSVLIPGDPDNKEPEDRTNAIWHRTGDHKETPAVIRVIKEADPAAGACVCQDDIIEYTLKLENIGKGTAFDIGVFDTFPEGTEYVEGSVKGGQAQDKGVGFYADLLEPGGTTELSFKVRVKDNKGNKTIINQATWGASREIPSEDFKENSTNIIEHLIMEPESSDAAEETYETESESRKGPDTITIPDDPGSLSRPLDKTYKTGDIRDINMISFISIISGIGAVILICRMMKKG